MTEKTLEEISKREELAKSYKDHETAESHDRPCPARTGPIEKLLLEVISNWDFLEFQTKYSSWTKFKITNEIWILINTIFIRQCDTHNIWKWILTREQNISFWIFVICTQCCVIIKNWYVLQRVIWLFWYAFFCNNNDCVLLSFGDICRCYFSLENWLKHTHEILLKYRNISHKNCGFFFSKNYQEIKLLYIRDKCKSMNVVK